MARPPRLPRESAALTTYLPTYLFTHLIYNTHPAYGLATNHPATQNPSPPLSNTAHPSRTSPQGRPRKK
ncbi:hypothetical protein AOQ84DRAFT_32808 [Glonium stellatum]|uniref:Uncharacterized protein n=1 Tax=Glonium stellatum TaxID=574774 RepID=A0A8E2F241_9PEZI|nr:hypothetical protein AOQ84DRAFT_32808 [Glonium stellatum]